MKLWWKAFSFNHLENLWLYRNLHVFFVKYPEEMTSLWCLVYNRSRESFTPEIGSPLTRANLSNQSGQGP